MDVGNPQRIIPVKTRGSQHMQRLSITVQLPYNGALLPSVLHIHCGEVKEEKIIPRTNVIMAVQARLKKLEIEFLT